MTILEIEMYLRRHHFLIFRFNNDYYTLKKTKSFIKTIYSLIPTDAPSQHGSTLEELCDNVMIENHTSLREAIQSIVVPDWNDSSWESFEAIRHCAIVHGSEIKFFYEGKDYWIAHVDSCSFHLSDNAGDTQVFASCRELFSCARINGKTLKEIWNNVIVDAC
ncbi:MAG: hypothetical protein IK082_06960 [Oscillospiraceae bacterium]|nr:hypothetical protein [Oscillospiraceae bacterium]